MTNADPTALAAGLSKAQKRALMGVKQMYRGEHLINSSVQRKTQEAVAAAGLVERSTVFPNTFRLTDLGLLVRQSLADRDGEG